jgi:propanediol dehydratase small subunit
METLFIVLAVVALCVIGQIVESRRMRLFWNRKCAGGQWKKRFPAAPKSEIRDFLRMFVEAFGFRDSRKLCFTPDDRVMDVYRILYPPKWSAVDFMELETFVESFQRAYGIDLIPPWRDDVTLGELYAEAGSGFNI